MKVEMEIALIDGPNKRNRIFKRVDLLLDVFKRREQNGVRDARPSHRDAESYDLYSTPLLHHHHVEGAKRKLGHTAIHLLTKPLDLRHLHQLAPTHRQTVTLIPRLGRIDRIGLTKSFGVSIRWWICLNNGPTEAQETRPQSPPAMATGPGEVGDELPWNVAVSCLTLS